MASQYPGGSPVTPPPPYAPGPGSGGLVDRARNILMSPATEWPRIDAQPITVSGIFTGYAVPLAAIGPISGFVGSVVFAHSVVLGLIVAVVSYVLALVTVWITSQILNLLAPSFGAQQNIVAATKLAVFSYTAAWVAGVFQLIPVLGSIMALVGVVYSFYLLWLGLPILMKTSADKAVGYFVVTIIVQIVVGVVIFLILGAIVGLLTIALIGGGPHAVVVGSLAAPVAALAG